jgi:hypothetical protein
MILDNMPRMGYNRYMEIKTTKEELKDRLVTFLNEDFLKSLETTDLDQDEKEANIVLSRKKILADADNISTLVFKAFE